MIRGTDGLDYLDITHRLLGQPIQSWRNSRIQALRAEGASEEKVRAYIEWHDSGTTGTSPLVIIVDDLGPAPDVTFDPL